jgi:hypothetical protein
VKISDSSKRTVTIVLEDAEIADIETMCRRYLNTADTNHHTRNTAENILEALEVN